MYTLCCSLSVILLLSRAIHYYHPTKGWGARILKGITWFSRGRQEGSVIADRVLGGAYRKLTANELPMGVGRWDN